MDKELDIILKTYLRVADLCKEIKTKICEGRSCIKCPFFGSDRCRKAIRLFDLLDVYKK